MKGWTAVLVVALWACGSASVEPGGATPRGVGLPELQGRVVYHRPIEHAEPAVRDAYHEVQRLLADRLPFPPAAGGMAAYERWSREALRPWMAARTEALRELGDQLVALGDRGPAERLFAVVLYATLHEDIVAQVSTLPVPAELRDQPETAAAFRRALAGTVQGLARNTAAAWRQCAAVAPQAPEAVRGWGEECARRAAGLEELAPSESASSPGSGIVLPRAPQLPAHCEGDASYEQSPEAPPPDDEARREVAILFTGDRLEGADREALLTAIHAKLEGALELPIVPRREMQRFERLHAQRRIAPREPVCGQAPPLPAIVARRHPNLVLAQVNADCYTLVRDHLGGPDAEGRSCTLTVYYRRAGSADRDGLPEPRSATVEAPADGSDPPPSSWVAAAERLGPPRGGGILGALAGGLGTSYRVLGIGELDPWLRVGPTLHGDVRDRVLECLPGAGVASFDLAWTITPTGGTRALAVRAGAEAPPADEAVRACVERVLAGLAWPCTPSGRPERVEARLCFGRADAR